MICEIAENKVVCGQFERMDTAYIVRVARMRAAIGEQGLVLGDEVLTPDSSRFWPADAWRPGRSQPGFDKQYVRYWLLGPDSGWDRASDTPPPPLPQEVVEATRARYVEAYERLTGQSFEAWTG